MSRIGFVIPTIRKSSSEISTYLAVLNEYFECDIQIVIVNDNPEINFSFDATLELTSKFEIVIVNNKKQIGPGASRNVGMRLLNTDWVGFLDDDDLLLPRPKHSIENLLELETDIVCLNFEDSRGTFSNVAIFDKINTSSLANSADYCSILLALKRLPTHCQHYIFRVDFLNKNSISFLPTFVIEDISFICEAIVKAKYIVFDENPYYYYISRTGTSKEDVDVRNLQDIYAAIVHLLSLAREHSLNFDLSKNILVGKIIQFLEIFFISRYIAIYTNSLSHKIEFKGVLKHQNVTMQFNFQKYLENVERKITLALSSYFDRDEIVAFYCLCPMSIGLIEILKMGYCNKKIIIVDDSFNINVQNNSTNRMHPTKFYCLLKNEEFSNECGKVSIVICHLHSYVQEKIRNSILLNLEKINLTGEKIRVITFEDVFNNTHAHSG